MKTVIRKAAALALAGALAGLTACSTLGPGAVTAGQTESEVVAKLGQPTHRYQDGNGRLLEYKTGPMGQYTWMARIGPDNRLVSYEQVLTDQKFGAIQPDQARKEDVLRIVGAPSETSYLPRVDQEVWSYPYRQSGVWNSVMHVHFDKNGVVRRLVNAPDMRYERDGFFGSFGGFGFGL
jgi:hypothetical protein